ncbi:hypothetical protein QBC44DRAFT_331827 [Cladorrhinum sp. PSN332]|nr:hypothetical protein QBC44DRAFT_331827 [Cladorrhinum sp. PSN332]
MSPRPGIIIVRSGIISDDLTVETFSKWYEEIHIPDVLATAGVKAAARYQQSTSAQPGTLPYLAVYNLDDLNWLHQDACEFWKIPLHSNVLPNDKQTVFTWAKFETEFYAKVETSDGDVDQDDTSIPTGDSLLAVWWERTPSHSADYAKVIIKTLKRNLADFGVQGEPRLTLFKADESGICPPAMRNGQSDSKGEARTPSLTKYLCLVCTAPRWPKRHCTLLQTTLTLCVPDQL